MHQYLDSDSSGQSSTIVSPTIGEERLVEFTNWLKTNDRRGFLGEFAVANSRIGTSASQIGDEAIDNMLGYIAANDEVWLGWTWWAGGPWWGDYRFSLDPTNLGQMSQADKAAMAVLQRHLAIGSESLPGDYNEDQVIDAADFTVWRDRLGDTVALANDDTLGVDLGDYIRWKENFGQTPSSIDGAAALPEPSAIALTGIAIAGAAFHRRWFAVGVTRAARRGGLRRILR